MTNAERLKESTTERGDIFISTGRLNRLGLRVIPGFTGQIFQFQFAENVKNVGL
jgi:hypothetical protein